MAPKKKEVQKFSLNDFLNDSSGGGGSWADEVEETVVNGTQQLPPVERRGPTSSSTYNNYGASGDNNRGGYSSIRDNLPQKLPDKPPFTAHLGNLSYDATVDSVNAFFAGCSIVNVRIIEDREQNRPKGFAYAEFAHLEGLKRALTLDGNSFEGRSIRIKIADPPKNSSFGGSDITRDFSDWTRKGPGPLPDVPGARPERRTSNFERRPPRDGPAEDGSKIPDLGNWERRGPVAPPPSTERPPRSRDGSRAPPLMERSESRRGPGYRRESPVWGPGEGRQEGSRPPRREFVERPEKASSMAEKDFNWRVNMRTEAPAVTSTQSHEGSEAPPSPAASAQVPATRPRLNLAKRTVPETPEAPVPASSAALGPAQSTDTAPRERDSDGPFEPAFEPKVTNEQTIDATATEVQGGAVETTVKANGDGTELETAESKSVEQQQQQQQQATGDKQDSYTGTDSNATGENGGPVEQNMAVRPKDTKQHKGPREPRERESQLRSSEGRTRPFDNINWRQASAEQRAAAPSRGGAFPSGPRRGGAPPRGPRNDGGRPSRTNGSGPTPINPAQASESGAEQGPSTPAVDEDGWTTVNKSRRGQSNRS